MICDNCLRPVTGGRLVSVHRGRGIYVNRPCGCTARVR